MTDAHAPGSPVGDQSLSRAMFFYGFAMFMLVYMVQPLMPRFVAEFAITPVTASYALSAATGGMALFLIPSALHSHRIPLKRLLVGGLVLCALLSIASLLVADFAGLVGLRLLFGILLSALPAAALALLADAIPARQLGKAVGLYIAGNAMGGMSGRLLALALSEWLDWRAALAWLGMLALAVAWHVARVLPTRALAATVVDKGPALFRMRRLLRDPALLALFLLAFLLSGTIVSVYNYISFRLSAAPYHFDYVALCGVYGLYVVGMLGSARAGRWADRYGRGPVLAILPVVMGLGLLLTLRSELTAVLTGVAVLTFGFFGGHSVASGWVSARATADRTLASSLYLTAYYLGASTLGTLAGTAWSQAGWVGVVLMNSAMLTIALFMSLLLRQIRPLPPSRSPEMSPPP